MAVLFHTNYCTRDTWLKLTVFEGLNPVSTLWYGIHVPDLKNIFVTSFYLHIPWRNDLWFFSFVTYFVGLIIATINIIWFVQDFLTNSVGRYILNLISRYWYHLAFRKRSLFRYLGREMFTFQYKPFRFLFWWKKIL